MSIDRLCVAPLKFGNELLTIFIVIDLPSSLTEYVPKYESEPCDTALFSSAVPCCLLLDENFGISERMFCHEKWPAASNMSMPVPAFPLGSIFLPSGRV